MNWKKFDEDDPATWPDQEETVLAWGSFWQSGGKPVFRTVSFILSEDGDPIFDAGEEGCLETVEGWCVPQSPEESAKFVQIPRGLTYENGAKAALMGEFHINREVTDDEGNEDTERIDVPWVTIKEIYSAVVRHFQASTKKQAVAHHERTSGVCRWGVIVPSIIGTNTLLATECGETIAQNSRAKASTYCPNCGKKVEVEE